MRPVYGEQILDYYTMDKSICDAENVNHQLLFTSTTHTLVRSRNKYDAEARCQTRGAIVNLSSSNVSLVSVQCEVQR